jgi:hypothetical protein
MNRTKKNRTRPTQNRPTGTNTKNPTKSKQINIKTITRTKKPNQHRKKGNKPNRRRTIENPTFKLNFPKQTE